MPMLLPQKKDKSDPLIKDVLLVEESRIYTLLERSDKKCVLILRVCGFTKTVAVFASSMIISRIWELSPLYKSLFINIAIFREEVSKEAMEV